MITGLIHVPRPRDPEAIDRLADTLASLVTGVAAGLVGDAVIVAQWGSEALETIAEGSGAELVLSRDGEHPWLTGGRAARREWVLCLEAGDVLREGWIRSLDRFVGTAAAEVGLARLRRPRAGFRERVARGVEGVFGAARPRAGDLARRERVVLGPVFRPRLVPRPLGAQLDRL